VNIPCPAFIRTILFSLLFPLALSARVLEVGPARALTLPSQAAAVAQDGDTVLIDAGVYVDACRWTAHNLLLRGTGGFAHVKDRTYGGKAIWVIQGNNATVEWIEFSGATVPDKNGAGIRQEGVNLTVRSCFFHDNEDGILAGDNVASRILLEYCEFARNGFGDGYSHNMYINHIAEFTIRYSYVHHARVGHNIKSRAHRTFIICNGITSGDDGTTSREIDLPNGGLAIVAGNVIVHGGSTQNSNLIGYGQEGLSNPVHSLFVTHNTVVTARNAGTFVSVPAIGCDTVVLKNNLFAGRAEPFGGAASVFDSAANFLARDIADLRFSDPGNFDFHPLVNSPAVDAAQDAGSAWGLPLLPAMEYVHPAAARFRVLAGTADAGALEYLPPVSIPSFPRVDTFDVDGPWPNPAAGRAYMHISGARGAVLEAEVIDYLGMVVRRVREESHTSDARCITIDLQGLPSGWYICRIAGGDAVASRVLIVY
jgi:hypothetical protein